MGHGNPIMAWRWQLQRFGRDFPAQTLAIIEIIGKLNNCGLWSQIAVFHSVFAGLYPILYNQRIIVLVSVQLHSAATPRLAQPTGNGSTASHHSRRMHLYAGRTVPSLDSRQVDRLTGRWGWPMHFGQRAVGLPQSLECPGVGEQVFGPDQADRTEDPGRRIRRRQARAGATVGQITVYPTSARGVEGAWPAIDSRELPALPGRGARSAPERSHRCGRGGLYRDLEAIGMARLSG
jgi:hypothetical protein